MAGPDPVQSGVNAIGAKIALGQALKKGLSEEDMIAILEQKSAPAGDQGEFNTQKTDLNEAKNVKNANNTDMSWWKKLLPWNWFG